ncbi:helix-turn-helix domain-containing protein [Jannaschia aquimarina]|uniref:AraC_1 protein n=1 Tax=Jannaschia aquimarina TaxID=935700 RepID=A0A0D1DDM3_9RHOB|nr:AraC family transcriptional regulator [Jannaschia aquimarina]KIT18093.1 Arabinose operon regulatory protein [Jannaschia aquimarina]SNT40740.1 Helix-turn-helix domain-containing protein [Jannaschia aquimarina]
MDDYALNVPDGAEAFAPHASPRAHVCPVTRMTVTALPPGRVKVRMHDVPFFMTVAPTPHRPRIDRLTLDGQDLRDRSLVKSQPAFDLFTGGSEHEVSASNRGWHLMVEVPKGTLPDIVPEAWDDRDRLDVGMVSSADPVAVQLGRLALDHLRQGAADRLYVEGLSIALTARAVGLLTGRGDTPPTGGTDKRIARAVDFIEAHIADDLSVAGIARNAAMSPSWFAASFRGQMGRSVHAYVMERRCERARLLIAEQRLSLAQIAVECGFAHQAHMGRAFKRRFGVTPARARTVIF